MRERDYNLVCGDCVDVLGEMPPESVDCIVTDPPYKTITGGDCGCRPKGILSGNSKLFRHQNDTPSKDWFPLLYKVLKYGCHAYVFTNFLNIREMMENAEKTGFRIHNLLVWEKNNKTPSQFYMKNCEYVLFLRKGKAKYINNIGSSNTVHRFANVIGTKTHPCEKPIDLLRYYIENSTTEGEVVLDPFMGTGSCGIASIGCKRRFVGIELDEMYFSVAKDRIAKATDTPVQYEFAF